MRRLAELLAAATCCVTAVAQCPPTVVSYGGTPGPDGIAQTQAIWDPDGPGPLPARLVVGGRFRACAGVPADNVATYDPATGAWSALGAGLGVPSFAGGPGDSVASLVVTPSGELVAAGILRIAGTPASVARWTGANWTPVGNLPGPVTRLRLDASGDLLAIGYATTGSALPFLRRFDAATATWLDVAPTLPAGFVPMLDVAELPNGDVIVCGQFATVAGIAAANIARWDGAQWHALGAGLDTRGECLLVLPNGDVLCGGYFQNAGGAPIPGVARWNGAQWLPLGAGIGVGFTLHVAELRLLGNGDVLACGAFAGSAATSLNCVARFDGTEWQPYGVGFSSENGIPLVSTAIELPGGDITVGGLMTISGDTAFTGSARWNGTAWTRMAGGTSGFVRAVHAARDGSVYVGGDFRVVAGVDARYVARRAPDGTFAPLGLGMNTAVNALAELGNGDVVAGGNFTHADGQPVGHVARWDGAGWRSMAGGMNAPVLALASAPDGSLLAAGRFTTAGGASCARIARWNGVAWLPLGPGLNGDALTVAAAPDGRVMVGGAFTKPQRNLALWDGFAWQGLSAASTVRLACALPDGRFFADGRFWTGTVGTVAPGAPTLLAYAASVQPDGALLVGGWMQIAGQPATLVRYDGSSWTTVLGGTQAVRAVATTATGEVVLGGEFRTVLGVQAAQLASLRPSCPPAATSLGVGCGAPQPLRLQAEDAAWLGGVARSRLVGCAPGTIAVALRGIAAAPTPLPAALGPIAPNCTLWTQPTIVVAPSDWAGAEPRFALAIPRAAALIGLTWREQSVALGPTGVFAASDAIDWRIGAL